MTTGARQTMLLARTFFARFFESDLMPSGLPQVQLVIWSMSLLAAPGLLLPARLAGGYISTRPADAEVLARAILMHRLIFITLTMTALGIVALVIWDGMFPDRRDARVLTGLPVPGRVLIVGRLTALSALAGLFLAGVNLVPTLLYGPLTAAVGASANLFLGTFAHLVATTLAGLFVFCTLISLQGLVLNVGGRRAADRLAVILQILFIVGLLQMIFFLPRVASMLTVDARHVWSERWLLVMPSVWFLALYDVLDGIPAPGAGPIAIFAVLATAFVAATAVGLFAATHARLTRLAIEARDAGSSRGRAAWVGAFVTGHISGRPVSQAVFEFTLRTIMRSRSHRLLLSMYVGCALALICSAVVPLAILKGFAGFAEPGLEVLSAPLVFGFFVLVGGRVAFAIPVEPKAAWAVRVVEPDDRNAAIDGVRAAMLIGAVLPMTVLGAASAGALWGGRAALAHGALCAAMGWLLVEILLMRFEKIPFTCSYYPGRSRIRTLWPFYLTGFITYSYSVATWEADHLHEPARIAAIVGAIAVAIAVLTIVRHRTLSSAIGLRFAEEDPATLFGGFQLSEGFAAAPKEVRRLQ